MAMSIVAAALMLLGSNRATVAQQRQIAPSAALTATATAATALPAGHRGPPAPDPRFAWIAAIENSGGGKTFQLKAQTYYIDRNYVLPDGTSIVGAGSGGSGGTLIVAVATRPEQKGGKFRGCGPHHVNRIGFVLGSRCRIARLHYMGIERARYPGSHPMCGGAPFQTPGCATPYCENAGNASWLVGSGKPVHDSIVEDISISGGTVQNAFWMPQTVVAPAGGGSAAGPGGRWQRQNYTELTHMNCWTGHGGVNIDHGPAASTFTVPSCQARCDATKGCHCVVMSANASASNGVLSGCWRRSSCVPAKCVAAGAFNTWLKPGSPPLPPPPPPLPPPPPQCTNITVRNLVVTGSCAQPGPCSPAGDGSGGGGTWADGINIHGAHRDVIVEGCRISHTGDDGFAMWSAGSAETGVAFVNNSCASPCFPRPGMSCGASCFAMYGGNQSAFINNSCVQSGQRGALYLSGGFGGSFIANTSFVTISGNKFSGCCPLALGPCSIHGSVKAPGCIENASAPRRSTA
jgi:hypothetical protein